MDSFSKVQVIWTETKDLRVPLGGNAATLMEVRRRVAALADAAPDAFTRFEPVPAKDDSLYVGDLGDCINVAESDTSALRDRQVIIWPSADGKTLSQDVGAKPPQPWDVPQPDVELVGRFQVEGNDVSVFSRKALAADTGRRFVSLVTGTGLPDGTAVFAPRATGRKPVEPRVERTATWLAVLSLVLFSLGCLWSLSVGNVMRSAQTAFASMTEAAACPFDIDLNKLQTLFTAPAAWLPKGSAPSDCDVAWRKATGGALAMAGRDWTTQLKQWLADWVKSDAGSSFSLVLPTLFLAASVVLLAVAVGLGVVGRPLGLFIDKRNRMSLTRVQFAVWLVVIIAGLASTSLYNVGFWAGDLSRVISSLKFLEANAQADQQLSALPASLSGLLDFIPQKNAALWGLIGITAGTTIVSSFLMQPTAPGSASSTAPARRTRVLTNADPKDAGLSDLVFGETEEDEGVVDSTRVQAIALTGLLVAIYASLVLQAGQRLGGLTAIHAVNAGAQVFASMPPVGATFLMLLVASHGTLLGGKLVSTFGRSGSKT